MFRGLDLLRVEESDSGVFGVLLVDGQAFCLTLEPPDRGNRPNVSCIPPGRYLCRRVRSPRFGETFEVTGVPDRSHILIHAGNLASDTQGCILTGRRFGRVAGAHGSGRGVLESRAALNELLDRLRELESCELRVHPCSEPVGPGTPPDPGPRHVADQESGPPETSVPPDLLAFSPSFQAVRA